MAQNAHAELLFNPLNVLSGDDLDHVFVMVRYLSFPIVDLVHYSKKGIIVSFEIRTE